ncbi:Proton-dependent oligopeptide transporter family [Sesbania bispinosa]|nr:Proton-dependent oligopeptide transporter family [Sesbania bispinosa]
MDKAATIIESDEHSPNNPWRLCTVTQVEEAKCVLTVKDASSLAMHHYLLCCVYTNCFSICGAGGCDEFQHRRILFASMSQFDICNVLVCTGIYRQILVSLPGRLSGNPKGLTELQRMGIGLIIGPLAMVASGATEIVRLRHIIPGLGATINVAKPKAVPLLQFLDFELLVSLLTDAVAMDYEMVGVGQGNKSTIGRVTLKCVHVKMKRKRSKWRRVITDGINFPIDDHVAEVERAEKSYGAYSGNSV